MRRVAVVLACLVLGAWTCAPVDDGGEPMTGPTTTGLAALISGESWIGVSGAFENSWSNASGSELMYYRYREPGIVDLRGVVDSGTPGATIFTLPEDYRPANQSTLSVTGLIGTTPSAGLLIVTSTGRVYGARGGSSDHETIYIQGSIFINTPT